MTSADRMLLVLQLFTPSRPVWTVEQAATALHVSLSTAYRYFRTLGKAGLVEPVDLAGSYSLGPGIVQLDHNIQESDPLLCAARPVMRWLVGQGGTPGTLLLCRLYRERVMCIHQERRDGDHQRVSYERGLLLPMFRGASSKVILAHLPARQMARMLAGHHPLPGDTFSLAENLRAIRRDGVCVSRGELDQDTTGIAVPLFAPDAVAKTGQNGGRQVIGSLGLACREVLDPAATLRASGMLAAAAQEIALSLRESLPQAAALYPQAALA